MPEEIARRQRLREKMEQAQANLEKRAQAKAATEREKYEAKLKRHETRQQGEHRGGTKPKPPENKGPQPTDQTNLTDDDSRLMRKNRRAEFRQAYNAQAVVDADGSQLILGNHVTNCASEANELEPALAGIDPSVDRPKAALADNGYLNGDAVERLQGSGVDIYMPVSSEDGNNQRCYDSRLPKVRKKKELRDKRLIAMREKMKTDEARRLYAKRKQTVEPVFGIIKSVLGFRSLHLRSLENMSSEWSLVALAYNMKRLYALKPAPAS